MIRDLWQSLPPLAPYAWLAPATMILTVLVWWRLPAGEVPKRKLLVVYGFGLLGAIIGAKLAFLFAEGWRYQADLTALMTGRSITGGLLGGYIGVESGKKLMEVTRSTGDRFAIIVPLGIALGRISCVVHGCCRGAACGDHWWAVADDVGVPRWPAAWIELLFNAGFLVWVLVAASRGWQRNNRFSVYLIAYGLFRFAHEFMRDDPALPGLAPWTGYHVIALATVGFGIWRYRAMRRYDAALVGELSE